MKASMQNVANILAALDYFARDHSLRFNDSDKVSIGVALREERQYFWYASEFIQIQIFPGGNAVVFIHGEIDQPRTELLAEAIKIFQKAKWGQTPKSYPTFRMYGTEKPKYVTQETPPGTWFSSQDNAITVYLLVPVHPRFPDLILPFPTRIREFRYNTLASRFAEEKSLKPAEQASAVSYIVKAMTEMGKKA